MKGFTPELIGDLKAALPDAFFVGRDNDLYPELKEDRTSMAHYCDLLFMTNAGKYLHHYKDHGNVFCAFLPNPCDPDIHYRYNVDNKWRHDIMFSGKIANSNMNCDQSRIDTLEKLSKMSNAKIYGAYGQGNINGIDYFHAISGAKIALSINVDNSIDCYHSDRFINNVASGTFTAIHDVPKSELLFKDKEHV